MGQFSMQISSGSGSVLYAPQHAAFFSATDDADDAGEVKISGVFGGLGPDTAPDVAFRLCVLGMFIPLKVPASAIFKQPEA